MNDLIIIENQFEWTNKIGHTALNEASKDKQRRIPWDLQYICQPFCLRNNLLDKKCHIFTWVIVYVILNKVLEEFLERIGDSITHI